MHEVEEKPKPRYHERTDDGQHHVIFTIDRGVHPQHEAQDIQSAVDRAAYQEKVPDFIRASSISEAPSRRSKPPTMKRQLSKGTAVKLVEFSRPRILYLVKHYNRPYT